MNDAKARRIIIGDVHGHYDGLMTLLETIAPSSEDQIYFLGDLIDRGPQSSQVVNFVKESSYPCLLGNHEQMLVSIITEKDTIPASTVQAWLYSGGQATLASYKKATIPHDHVEWFESLPTHLDLDDIWLVHAGVDPTLPIAEQTPDQLCWVRDEFHMITEPIFSDKLIIIGHTITFTLPGLTPGKIARGAGWLGIDTGAYHPKSGWLTGLDVTNSVAYQANVNTSEVRVLSLEEATVDVDFNKIRGVSTRRRR